MGPASPACPRFDPSGKSAERQLLTRETLEANIASVKKQLAQLLDLSFTDADDEIEKAAQMSVSEIFERFGVERFSRGALPREDFIIG